MEKKRLVVDQDGVLVDLVSEWVRRYNYDYNDTLSPSDIVAWNWCHLVKDSCGKKIYNYLDDPELFASLPVIENSQEILLELSHTYEIFVCTSPFNINNVLPKHQHILKHFSFINPDNIVFTRNKSILHADYLVDDKPANLLNFIGKKLLFSAPHNKDENRFQRLNDWLEVRDYLLKS